jgi:UDP-2-acetamido-3-amino-2,3-dideoxy-glucuronate N-acetyltransferase
MSPPPGVAVIGCGRWGANLIRVFARLGALRAVHDIDADAAAAAAARHRVPALDAEGVLSDPRVAAVVVAAAAGAHFPIAERALLAGKHVFVEKPLSLRVHDAERLCQLAESRRLVLMVGHLLRYHPAFDQLERVVTRGELGGLRYLYSQRLNLGRVRQEEDILWSFAPHDVSMILALLRGQEPERVWAIGGSYLTEGVADVTTTHLAFPGGVRAHVFVSWLHPFKEQKLVVVGERAMAVLDDGQPWESKLRLFRHAIHNESGVPEPRPAQPEGVRVEPREPLELECRHFLCCVETGATPLTDGREGVRVLRVIERAADSMGERLPGTFVHPSAYVDEPAVIGAGTSIWHFSHILAGSTIGRDCVIGQNVMIGPNVTIGDRCKIQNNVSVYEGVTLEDEVFCGPSCVFTNVATPRAGVDRRAEFLPTRVGRGATIGANATIVCGHTVGAWSFVAAGAVVTSDVPPHALVAGVPARRIGWISHAGERLAPDLVCPRTGRRYALRGPEELVEVVDG